MSGQSAICPQCGKEVEGAGQVGSLTSFLLTDLLCSCRAKSRSLSGKDAAKLCPRCHKVIPDIRRAGSLTAFFFKDIRCACDSAASSLETRYIDGRLTERRQKHRATIVAKTQAMLASDAAAFVELGVGKVIGGSYRLVALAGEGGMGSVYRAEHIALKRDCAVKLIAPSIVSEATWKLFQKEAMTISSLTHPTICQVYDLGIHAGSLPFYVMDFVQGETLDQILTRQGPLSVGATAELYIKVMEGLAYAHRRGVVHKDIKPANIMLEKAADGHIQVRILDFGISELSDSAMSGGDGLLRNDIMGSAAYMSPEQFVKRKVEPTSDIYSIGCSMFETLTGLPPFAGEDMKVLEQAHARLPAPTLSSATSMFFPPEIESIVARCLEKDARLRYQHASELSIDLQNMLEHKPLQFARTAQLTLNAGDDAAAADSTRGFSVFALPPVAVIAVVCVSVSIVLGALGLFVFRDKLGGLDSQTGKKAGVDLGVLLPENDSVGPIVVSEGRVGSFGYRRERFLVMDKLPSNAGQLMRVLEISKAQDYGAIFEELAAAKIAGVRVTGPENARVLKQVARFFPALSYLAVPDLASVKLVSPRQLANLQYLEVLANGQQTIAVSSFDGFNNLLLPLAAVRMLDCSPQASKAKVKRLVFRGGKITADDMKETMKRFDFDSILLADCDLDVKVLEELAKAPKKIDLIVYKRTLKDIGLGPADLDRYGEKVAVYIFGDIEALSLEASSALRDFAPLPHSDQSQAEVGVKSDTVMVAEGPIVKGAFRAADASLLLDERNKMPPTAPHRMLIILKGDGLYSILSEHKVPGITGVVLACPQEPRVLKVFLQCYPDITFLKLSAMGAEAAEITKEFKHLEFLEVSPDSKKISEVVIARPWKSIAIQNSDKIEFKKKSAVRPKVAELAIFGSTIDGATIEQMLSAMELGKVYFQSCHFSEDALSAFARSPKKIEVELYERKKEFEQAKQIVARTKTGKVTVSVVCGRK